MVSLDNEEHVVQNKAITLKLQEIENTINEIKEKSEDSAKLKFFNDIYNIIQEIDTMMNWGCCRTWEVCFKLMNGAPEGARISLYDKNSKFGLWGNDANPTVYWTNSSHNTTATAGETDNWMNYGAHTWLSGSADFVWNVDKYKQWTKDIMIDMIAFTSPIYEESILDLKTHLAYFKNIMVFFNNIFTNLFQGFKLNNSSTITPFTAQKKIISKALDIITEGEAWMNGII